LEEVCVRRGVSSAREKVEKSPVLPRRRERAVWFGEGREESCSKNVESTYFAVEEINT